MSKGRKSSYPERPAGGRRPSKPGEGRKRPSSEHIHGRRNVWRERADAPVERGARITYDKLVHSLCVFGHR